MAPEPSFSPGETEGVPPQSPTQFTPQKPAGPDPVSPMPLPEGSTGDRHAQLFAYDPGSGQFRPVEWTGGKLKVDAVFSGSITIGNVTIINPIGAPVLVADESPVQTAITYDADEDPVQVVEVFADAHTRTTTLTRNTVGDVVAVAQAVT